MRALARARYSGCSCFSPHAVCVRRWVCPTWNLCASSASYCCCRPAAVSNMCLVCPSSPAPIPSCLSCLVLLCVLCFAVCCVVLCRLLALACYNYHVRQTCGGCARQHRVWTRTTDDSNTQHTHTQQHQREQELARCTGTSSSCLLCSLGLRCVERCGLSSTVIRIHLSTHVSMSPLDSVISVSRHGSPAAAASLLFTCVDAFLGFTLC